MANMNTFAALRGLTQGNVTAISAFPTVAGGTTRATVGLTNDVAGNVMDGVPFRIRSIVSAVPGQAGNLTTSVYWNSGGNTNLTTLTNDKIFLTSGAVALGTQAQSVFVMSAVLVWDSVAQRLAGVNETSFHTIATPAALFSGAFAVTATNNPVSAGPITNVSGLQFFATALFGTSDPGNSCKLIELSLERV